MPAEFEYLPDHREWKRLYEDGSLDPYAWHFTAVLQRLLPPGLHNATSRTLLLLGLMTAQNSIAQKHICLTLANLPCLEQLTGSGTPSVAIKHLHWPEFDVPQLMRELDSAPFRQLIAINPAAGSQPDVPLVLEQGRLYLQRYWLWENQLADWLKKRAAPDMATVAATPTFATRTRLQLDPSQQQALASAWQQSFCVITGGPGSGKTTIMSVLIAAHLARDPSLRVQLCAPTGKAQARLQEALQHEIKENLICDNDPSLQAKLQNVSSATIHRLLQASAPLGEFRRNADRPLECDLLIVDEASMIDLELMVKLLAAVPDSCRVILLGDGDQLAAVESGMVLTEICHAWQHKNNLVRLTHSHRFDPQKGIGLLREAVRCGDATATLEHLHTGDSPAQVLSYSHTPATPQACHGRLSEFLAGHPWCRYPQSPDLAGAFKLFNTFKILCATHHGACGVTHVNQCLLELLRIKPYTHAYPVMITRNDYATGLFNGDIGLCWQPAANTSTRVYFPSNVSPGEFRAFERAQLPEHLPVFAMTIHKSQGSGFDEILLMLPPEKSPLLTRELIYTGITRARQRCAIWANDEILAQAVSTRTQRISGLTAKLQS